MWLNLKFQLTFRITFPSQISITSWWGFFSDLCDSITLELLEPLTNALLTLLWGRHRKPKTRPPGDATAVLRVIKNARPPQRKGGVSSTHTARWWASPAGRSAPSRRRACWGPPRRGRSSRSSEPSPCAEWRTGTFSLSSWSRMSSRSSHSSNWHGQKETLGQKEESPHHIPAGERLEDVPGHTDPLPSARNMAEQKAGHTDHGLSKGISLAMTSWGMKAGILKFQEWTASSTI